MPVEWLVLAAGKWTLDRLTIAADAAINQLLTRSLPETHFSSKETPSNALFTVKPFPTFTYGGAPENDPYNYRTNKEACEARRNFKLTAFEGLLGQEAKILLLKHIQWVFSPKEFRSFVERYCDMGSHVLKRQPFFIFSGPPGTCKTEIAQRTARYMGVDLLIVEPGHIQGQDSQPTSKLLQQLAVQIRDKGACVVLFDEIDHLIARDIEGGEATAARSQFRQLIDGPSGLLDGQPVIFIGTTNQFHKLEPDMVSRAQVLHFDLPTAAAAAQDIARHAKHLDQKQHKQLASLVCEGQLSHRDIRECSRSIMLTAKSAEREPSFGWYEACFKERKQNYGLLHPEKTVGVPTMPVSLKAAGLTGLGVLGLAVLSSNPVFSAATVLLWAKFRRLCSKSSAK